jgi:hypothetical protein
VLVEMKNKNEYQIISQLALPFLETHLGHIPEIFEVLEGEFGLKRGSQQVLADLGSGDGRVVIYSGLNYNIKSVGYEISPILVRKSRQRLKNLKKNKTRQKNLLQNIEIRQSDLFEQNLGNYDFIYIFSLPTMQKYLKHLFNTAKKEAVIISYKYPLEGLENYLILQKVFKHKNFESNYATFIYSKI